MLKEDGGWCNWIWFRIPVKLECFHYSDLVIGLDMRNLFNYQKIKIQQTYCNCMYCTISIDSSVTCHRALWSGPNFGTCQTSHWFWSNGKNSSKKALIMCAIFPSIDLLWYHIWLSLLQINFQLVANSVCHRSLRKWSECQNTTAMSRVTPPDESIEMVQY